MSPAVVPSPEDREFRATVRRYRRNGYAVAIPARGDPVPAFLEGLRPDLVAERRDDRVVVEIRQADMVPGSNDLVPLAARVDLEPGWRFEFISVAPPIQVKVGHVSDEVDRLLASGFDKAAFLVCLGQIENLILATAIGANLKRLGRPVVELSRELVMLGAISGDSYETIRKAFALGQRSAMLPDDVIPDYDEIAALQGAVLRLRDEVGNRKTV